MTTAVASNGYPGYLNAPTLQELAVRKNIRWGYEVMPSETRITCIKLFLESGQELPEFVSRQAIATELQKHSRTVVAAVADFLHKVHEHTLATLTLRWGDGFIHSTKIEYVLTCPAIWSDYAKDRTLQAAKQAGLTGKITMISEVSSFLLTMSGCPTNQIPARGCCGPHFDSNPAQPSPCG